MQRTPSALHRPLRAGAVLALAAALLACGARPLPAQGTGALGLSLGVSRPPAALQGGCGGPETLAALEVRAGLGRGALLLEARGSAQAEVGIEACVAAPLSHPDGVHTDRLYPFERGDLLAADLRLRYAPGVLGPFALSAGGGRAWPQELPYVVTGAGVRTPGRVRFIGEVERTWFRVPSEALTREWKNYIPVREISREESVNWEGGWGVRLGIGFGTR